MLILINLKEKRMCHFLYIEKGIQQIMAKEAGVNVSVKPPPAPSPLRKAKFFKAKMRILVTGGAGFIGSHLVDKLMENDENEVIVVDNYFTGSKDNLKQWIGHPRFELLRRDVTQPLLVEVDQIYHLACPASPIFYKYNPVKTLKTNVIGTLNMLGLAKRVGARILLTSTSEVYGDPLVHPQEESYWGNVNPIGTVISEVFRAEIINSFPILMCSAGVRSCYDEGKRVAETLMFDYHRQHGVEIRIARIFNTYGPRMNIDDGRVVSNFIAQAIRSVAWNTTRSFCYVSDMVDGLIRLMEGDDTGPINIGNPGEFTMIELAEAVKEWITLQTTLDKEAGHNKGKGSAGLGTKGGVARRHSAHGGGLPPETWGSREELNVLLRSVPPRDVYLRLFIFF
ncbi:UNVERIFIED_CONTAM: UDP-glucuronic acid decarboxylase 5 [Sesamum radiatum]|uniref:UDP-glucuronic acid decarboxylase 1 n=1 Tax=Sesamum radiatum TaxID=300843 RepID=A0AAW2R2T6_SESRA